MGFLSIVDLCCDPGVGMAGVVSKHLEYILDVYSSSTLGGHYASFSLYVLVIK